MRTTASNNRSTTLASVCNLLAPVLASPLANVSEAVLVSALKDMPERYNRARSQGHNERESLQICREGLCRSLNLRHNALDAEFLDERIVAVLSRKEAPISETTAADTVSKTRAIFENGNASSDGDDCSRLECRRQLANQPENFSERKELAKLAFSEAIARSLENLTDETPFKTRVPTFKPAPLGGVARSHSFVNLRTLAPEAEVSTASVDDSDVQHRCSRTRIHSASPLREPTARPKTWCVVDDAGEIELYPSPHNSTDNGKLRKKVAFVDADDYTAPESVQQTTQSAPRQKHGSVKTKSTLSQTSFPASADSRRLSASPVKADHLLTASYRSRGDLSGWISAPENSSDDSDDGFVARVRSRKPLHNSCFTDIDSDDGLATLEVSRNGRRVTPEGVVLDQAGNICEVPRGFWTKVAARESSFLKTRGAEATSNEVRELLRSWVCAEVAEESNNNVILRSLRAAELCLITEELKSQANIRMVRANFVGSWLNDLQRYKAVYEFKERVAALEGDLTGMIDLLVTTVVDTIAMAKDMEGVMVCYEYALYLRSEIRRASGMRRTKLAALALTRLQRASTAIKHPNSVCQAVHTAAFLAVCALIAQRSLDDFVTDSTVDLVRSPLWFIENAAEHVENAKRALRL